jgi:hypothetical protein
LRYLARFLDYFYARDPAWTQNVILSAQARPAPDREAMQASFLTTSEIGNETLYALVKPAWPSRPQTTRWDIAMSAS